jgi:topoisomerase-like DNA binding C4 zinc finger protein
MLIAQIEQFTQALFGKTESVLIVCAVLILVVGIPLCWLKLKAENALIRGIRSARTRRQTKRSVPMNNASETVPHCPLCNALMVKRVARRRANAGSAFFGCTNYPKCHGTRAI